MTNDETYDPASGPEVAGDTIDIPQASFEDTDPSDTTMAAGTPSGAAGVANAELGTSGRPAQTILSPEELAQIEIAGGAGLAPDAADRQDLGEYFGETHPIRE